VAKADNHEWRIKHSSKSFLPDPSEKTSEPAREIIATANKEVEAEKKVLYKDSQ